MSRILAAVLLSMPLLAWGQVTSGPPITGTLSTVNDGPGDQTDPHVSGDWVAYTSELNGTSEIRYHHLTDSTDAAIPSNGGLDFLSDISGSTLVFTHVTSASAIELLDVSQGGAPVELDPQPGSNRREGRIGGGTVVWQDFAFTGDLSTPELVAYDVAAQTSTRLTDDALLDKDPAVSPDGQVVAWTKCQQDGTGCHIFDATRTGTSWTSNQLTSGAEEAAFPDTNGQLVVYSAVRTENGVSDEDIYWQPVGGGAEHRLALPDRQTNPNISGNLIAFEGFDSTAALPNFDIYLFDVSSQTLYRLTDTPEDETLNDVSLENGVVRVVWTRSGADYNVYAYSFQEPGPVGCAEQAQTTCEAPGARPLVASLEMERTGGDSWWQHLSFSAEAGDGLMCISNGSTGVRATAGIVDLNGVEFAGTWAFKHWVGTIDGHVDLRTSNRMDAIILGEPGSGYHVNVYGPIAGCGDASQGNLSQAPGAPLVPGGAVSSLHGRHVLSIDGAFVAPPKTDATPAVAAGCSSTGSDAAGAGLLTLVALLFVLARPVPVRVRASRRRR